MEVNIHIYIDPYLSRRWAQFEKKIIAVQACVLHLVEDVSGYYVSARTLDAPQTKAASTFDEQRV